MTQLIYPTLPQIERVVPVLDKARFRRLIRVILKFADPLDNSYQLTAREQGIVYLYEWLAHLNFMAEDQIRWIVSMAWSAVAKEIDEVALRWPSLGRPWALVICDRRFVTWPMYENWLDLEQEQTVRKDDGMLVTSIGCDLPALFQFKQRMLRKLGGTDAERADGSAQEPVRSDQGASAK